MGLYISDADVKVRTAGKIQYVDVDDNPNAVGPTFLAEVIAEAEAEVEMRLSVRYAVPFQTVDGLAFDNLPTNTKILIKTLCREETVRRLISYDFGRGTAIEGEHYAIALMKAYEAKLERLVSIREGQFNMFKYPPLEGLRLSYHNDQADDGYSGRIFNTSQEYGAGAASQINDPLDTYWNGELPE